MTNVKRMPTTSKKAAPGKLAEEDVWNLRLYVAGQSPKSIRAFTNLRKLCEERLAGRYRIEVVDLLKATARR